MSSVFRGLQAERDALQTYVFPRLRDLCLQKGARFQAIDLRWGVSEEAALDQQTVNICIGEVERCQRPQRGGVDEPKPNFIVLLGDRYGWCPPPVQIPKTEWDELWPHAAADDQDVLETWYELDENARPPEYCLLPRGEDGRGHEDHDEWQPVEQQLRTALLDASRQVRALSDEDRVKYQKSVTEQEIARGALLHPDAHEHVFGFYRDIDGLPEFDEARRLHAEDPKHPVGEFLDLDAENPAEAHNEVVALKERLEPHLLNLDRYRATWTGNGITTDHIGTLPDTLEECLALGERLADDGGSTTLCEDVWRRLSALILAEIARLDRPELTTVIKEVEAHRDFGLDRAPDDLFVGRDTELNSIAAYIAKPDGHPLVLHGDSGSGKSAIMSMAARRAAADHPDDVVVRFIGATPESSDIRSLLNSLCTQLAGRYERAQDETGDQEQATREPTVPTEYRELVNEFRRALTQATAPPHPLPRRSRPALGGRERPEPRVVAHARPPRPA